jgi:hypothetical protein
MKYISKEKLYNKINALIGYSMFDLQNSVPCSREYQLKLMELNTLQKIESLIYNFVEEPAISIEVLKGTRDALYEEDAISFKGIQLINQILNKKDGHKMEGE